MTKSDRMLQTERQFLKRPMTFKELLNSVTFEEVAPHIVRMYPDMKNSLGWYKIHFDMLRQMKPKHHDDANDDVCHISLKDWEDGSGVHLDAYPMEGDFWEHSLTKEIILGKYVKVSNAELAACCLWHTSFYGFVEEQVTERFRSFGPEMNMMDRWDDAKYYRVRAMHNFSVIRSNGGYIPSIRELSPQKKQELIRKVKQEGLFCMARQNRIKRKRKFRKYFEEAYYERMAFIGDFIIRAIPSLKDSRNYLTTRQLCNLFHSEFFCNEAITSYAGLDENGSAYLVDVISKYNMLPRHDRMLVILTTGTWHEALTEDEKALSELLIGESQSGDIILATDEKLGNQVRVDYVAFNSEFPLVQ